MLLLPVHGRLHIVGVVRLYLWVKDGVIQLGERQMVARWAHAIAVRVADPVPHQTSVASQLVLEAVCHCINIVGHHLLQLLGAHHHAGPLHLILSEFLRKLTCL